MGDAGGDGDGEDCVLLEREEAGDERCDLDVLLAPLREGICSLNLNCCMAAEGGPGLACTGSCLLLLDFKVGCAEKREAEPCVTVCGCSGAECIPLVVMAAAVLRGGVKEASIKCDDKDGWGRPAGRQGLTSPPSLLVAGVVSGRTCIQRRGGIRRVEMAL